MENVDLIIRNAIVLTMDRNNRIIDKGTIAVKDHILVFVGRNDDLKTKFKSEKTIDAKGKMALPGFVNTHTHLYQTLMRGLGDDMKLFDWLSKMLFPVTYRLGEEELYYGALIGAIELMKSGVTCTVDNHVSSPCIGLSDASIKAVADLGMRGTISRIANNADPLKQGYPTSMLEDKVDSERDFIDLYKRWHGKESGRIRVWIAIGAAFVATRDFLIGLRELSRQYEVGLCIHFHETLGEVRGWKRKFGMSPIKYCHKIGFLGPDLLGAHCVWLDDEDISVLAKTQTKVSHNPVSNMYLASGICRVPDLLSSGVNVSLGVDGAASNNNQDMLEVMKTTALLQKVAKCNPLIITAGKVLEMATNHGAAAIGLDDEIGSLEKGKKADVILIDPNQPNMAPIYNFTSHIVYCARPQNVDTVIVDGTVVMEHGRIGTVNEETVVKKVQKMSEKIRDYAK